MLQYSASSAGGSHAVSALEIVPEEDVTGNDCEPFPPPPPPHLLLHPQQHFPPPPSSSSSSAHHLPTSSSAAASSSHSQLPPTGGVWSVFVSSASKEDNAHIIRFYLDQVFTSTREVIAFICGLIVFLLMILCLASPDWLLAEKFRQGLWVHCISEDAPLPLPFNITEKGDCFTVRNMGYIKASAALCVFCLLFDVMATAMTGCGLYSKDPVLKYRLYRYAVYTMIAALVSILIALIVYPSCFSAELDQSNRRLWEFGWAYGVGWGAAIFLFGSVVLLLCDKESEEIYYKERTIIHDNNESKA